MTYSTHVELSDCISASLADDVNDKSNNVVDIDDVDDDDYDDVDFDDDENTNAKTNVQENCILIFCKCKGIGI